MESSSFDDPIFCDFPGLLSPLGVKPHSVQVMLGMPNSSPDQCHQRLPEVHSLLPGSSKIDHHKTLEYSSPKIDYKIGSYSPTAKYDYGKCDQYSVAKLDYGKHHMDYMGGGVVVGGKHHHHEYSTPPPHGQHMQSKMDYDQNSMLMYQTSAQPQGVQHLSDTSSGSVMTADGPVGGGDTDKKKDGEQNDCSSVPSTTTPGSTDASSGSSKKNDKKKMDPNGAKKKKTR